MHTTLTLQDLIQSLERRYPPSTAQGWDAVGLVVGDPRTPIGRALLAVDPADAVVDEAIECGADLIITHHPLLLRGVHSVATTTPKGALVHRLIRSGIALYVAHTNADAAAGGVNEALADLLGLTGARPLQPLPGDDLDLLITYVPTPQAESVRQALGAAGAGQVGEYTGCAWSVTGTGEFTPVGAADPAIGTVGQHERVQEVRLEMVLPPSRRSAVVEALRRAHPYEEPAFSLVPTAAPPSPAGMGRIGELADPITVRDLAERVADVLPATAHGVRVGGDLDATVRTVAVCGGAGDSLLEVVAAAGADAYVTADLRHHPAGEALARTGAPALIDVAHWASEWPWLPVAAEHLRADAEAAGARIEVRVSTHPTDPWTDRLESTNQEGRV
ncbi:Nif3-like dinuclear metal center hexameric protein [Pseudactinotalea sp. Z1732]|uniref:Nif3-like dinuclear metal center hexameric protein n=1 Tax=Micrococcales TaxID=85006 RepID=UPI003C7B2B85